MKVKFRQAFFGPNSTRYRPGVEYDVPDSWAGKLPKSATVIDEAPAKAEKGVAALASAAAGSTAKGAKS